MGDPTGFLQQYGWGLGLLLWIITITVLETRRHLPGLVDWFKKSQGKEQEFGRKIKLGKLEEERLSHLMSLGSRTFMEEQLTQLTAEGQVLNETLVEFVVKETASKLDAIVEHNLYMAKRYIESENRILGELDQRLAGYQRRLDSIEERLVLIEGVVIRGRYDLEPDTGTDREPGRAGEHPQAPG